MATMNGTLSLANMAERMQQAIETASRIAMARRDNLHHRRVH
jgi:hypothetical protein